MHKLDSTECNWCVLDSTFVQFQYPLGQISLYPSSICFGSHECVSLKYEYVLCKYIVCTNGTNYNTS